MSHPFFFLGFALLLVHEMDAVRLGEWRIFPLLRSLRDEAGYAAFAALHVLRSTRSCWRDFSGMMVRAAHWSLGWTPSLSFT